MEFAAWDPSQDPSDARIELMRALMMNCKKQPIRNEIAAGSKVDQAVNATWAAMMYHTPALHHSLRTFGNSLFIYFMMSPHNNLFLDTVPKICTH